MKSLTEAVADLTCLEYKEKKLVLKKCGKEETPTQESQKFGLCTNSDVAMMLLDWYSP